MPQVTRRTFLQGATATVGAAGVLRAKGAEAEEAAREVGPDEELEVTLELNGAKKTLQVLPDTTLAEAIREKAGLTGTKTCCEAGACGACTVHVDGKPVNSCLTLALDADRAQVKTVEGVGGEALHAVQQAFIEADALQCGYCTPGFVMAGVAFYDAWRAAHGPSRPPLADVQRALSGNLCRCGAQPHLVEAVQSACEGTPAKAPGGHNPPWVVGRHDALEKVTGKATYAVDRYPEGVLHGVIIRSPHAAAEVQAIDFTKLEGMPGVRAALPIKTKRHLSTGGTGYGEVRYAGQEVAAVAADTLAQAEAAARAVAVTYNVKPHVVDWRDAEQESAPKVWEDTGHEAMPNAAEGFSAPNAIMQWEGNVRGPAYWPIHRDNEDARELARRSPHTATFSGETATQVHVPLERHVAVAEWEGDELTMYASSQFVQALAGDLAEVLGVPKTKVHVVSPYVGGAFGCKATLRPEHLAAARLAREAGKPVRVVLPLEDHIVVGGNRPGTQHHLTVGADEGGKLKAISHEARSMCGIAVGERATGLTEVHYDVAEKNLVDKSVVTHAAPSCPWRAPGYPPNAFALEQAVDDIAVKAGKDPLSLRIDQESRRRVRMLYRAALERCGYGERLSEVGAGRGRFVRGVGVATGEWFVLASPTARVVLKAYKDGHVEVSTATHDMGQGARSVLANVVAEQLRLPADRIVVKVGDSQLSTSMGSFGSITTPTITPATAKATEELRRILAKKGQKKVPGGQPVEEGLKAEDGTVTPWRELFETLSEEPTITSGQRGLDEDGYKLPPKVFDPVVGYSPFAIAKDEPGSVHITEVEVDRRLGRVKVVRSFVALDAGRIASPVTATSQVVGAVMQGTSYALYEGVRMDKPSGRQLNRNLETYPILGVADAPAVDVHFFSAPSPHNPYGSLGLGENSIVAAAAAVANGVYRATGKRVTRTPMTPQRVLEALGET